jgi:hypothetical protein
MEVQVDFYDCYKLIFSELNFGTKWRKFGSPQRGAMVLKIG